jgi:serine/threonine protein kinase
MLALDYCHRIGISSRDIKPENILLVKSLSGDIELRLADFGYSKDETMDSVAGTKLGTPTHTAPEIFKVPVGGSYDAKKADIWSSGVTLFEMVTGMLPFRRTTDASMKHSQRNMVLIQRIMSGDYEFPPERSCSDGVKDLISKMLVTGENKNYNKICFTCCTHA